MKHVVGYCRENCGACCKRITMPLPDAFAYREVPEGVVVPLPQGLTYDQRAFYAARGVRVYEPPVEGGGEVAFVPVNTIGHVRTFPYPTMDRWAVSIPSRCPHLTEDDKCVLHDTPLKPRLCVDGPVAPDVPMLKPDGCTFDVIDDGEE